MAMPRVLGKVLDGLARAFFTSLRAVAAVTGRSLSTSVILLMILVIAASVALVRVVGIAPVVVIHALVLVMLVRIAQIAGAYSKAFEARDFAEVTRLREIIEGKGEPRGRAMRAMKRVGDGELLIQFEKWEEAADILAKVELDALPEISRPGILSELGYARAHAGKVDKGVADIERAIAAAKTQESYPAEKRFHLARRHGIALSLASEHERAVEVLTPLREDFRGNPREWTETLYFLGRSHAGLEAHQEAAQALVSAAVGEGPFVGRAWRELESILDPDELAELRESIRKDQEKKN
jgi:tetratricopeptide (TPR) repeat protein